MSYRKSQPLYEKLSSWLTRCTISIFDRPYVYSGFKRFCNGVHIIQVAVFFLIVRMCLRVNTQPKKAVDRTVLTTFIFYTEKPFAPKVYLPKQPQHTNKYLLFFCFEIDINC